MSNRVCVCVNMYRAQPWGPYIKSFSLLRASLEYAGAVYSIHQKFQH